MKFNKFKLNYLIIKRCNEIGDDGTKFIADALKNLIDITFLNLDLGYLN
jgi:hypothetical protein